MTQSQARGTALRKSAENALVLPGELVSMLQNALPFYDMNAHAFCRAVVDGGENGNRSFCFGAGGGGIGSPHLIGSLGNDLSRMRIAAILL